MPYISIDLGDFGDDDIIEEVARRNLEKEISKDDRQALYDSYILLIQEIYERRRTNQNYDILLDKLIYLTIGKIL